MNRTRNIPDFIIVGTMKSGTSTLSSHLQNHKGIFLPKKEIHFFDRDDNFSKGVDWYQKELLRNCYDEKLLIGETTPTYSYLQKIPQRIHSLFPDTKIVWIFRNPVDRAYSNYLHALKSGVEKYSFEKALLREDERSLKNTFYGYKKRSIYHLQVENYLKYFKMEQMHFILFEDLIEPFSEKHVLIDLFHFLNLNENDFRYTNITRNETYLPRFPRLLYYAKKSGVQKSKIAGKTLNFVNYFRKDKGYKPISKILRQDLIEFFKTKNEILEKLIQKDLSIWDK